MTEKNVSLTTLCYIEKDEKYLMLHRVSKKNDLNRDKWIGVGGHFEFGESPEDCITREIKEETGLDAKSLDFVRWSHLFPMMILPNICIFSHVKILRVKFGSVMRESLSG